MAEPKNRRLVTEGRAMKGSGGPSPCDRAHCGLSQIHDHGTPWLQTGAEMVQYALEYGMLKRRD